MDLKTVFEHGKNNCTNCYNCPVCNGISCRGQIPGLGGKGTGSSFIKNYQKLQEVAVNMDTIMENCDISTKSKFFDIDVEIPVYGAPIGGLKAQYGSDLSEEDFAKAMIEGCLKQGTFTFLGDGKDINSFIGPCNEVTKHDGKGICTMKPWEKQGVDERLELFNKTNGIALASDIDASGLLFLRNAYPRITNFSVNDIKYVKSKINVPLIIKGIMTPAGAKKAYLAGADGIIVSNHGGRVQQDTQATIEVLEDIVLAVDGKMKVFVDGGFRTGCDVFKALALGADGVLIGRPMALSAIGEGSEGVSIYLDKIKTELKETMMMCGCKDIDSITRDKVKIIFNK